METLSALITVICMLSFFVLSCLLVVRAFIWLVKQVFIRAQADRERIAQEAGE